jgi:hypothetical protein
MVESKPDMPLTPKQIASTHTESAEQTALFAWCSQLDVKTKYSELEWLFHIPNGGARDRITAGRLKAEGVKSGVWDLFLPVPRGQYAGLWIEMKAGTNTLSPTQKRFRAFVETNHYHCVVCYSWEAAASALINYLSQ